MAETIEDVSQQITEKEEDLSQFDNMGDYMTVMKNVFNASYLANSDIIEQRKIMREALYGERGYKPPSMDMLSADQQRAIRLANRPGLTAGIQALNETEAARGRRIEDITGEVRTELEDRRSLLTAELDRLTSRRSELEAQQQQLQSENRSWALQALVDYPTLAGTLTQEELDRINKGQLDESILAKIGAAANIAAQQERALRYPRAPQSDIQKLKSSLPEGYDFRIQENVPAQKGEMAFQSLDLAGEAQRTGIDYFNDPNYIVETQQSNGQVYYNVYYNTPSFTGGGIDFYGPSGKIDKFTFTNETGVNWQSIVSELSTNPMDFPTDDEAEIRNQIQQASLNGIPPEEIALYIQAQGFKPADFGYGDYVNTYQ